ncbi:MAG: DNA topoisomerase IB [Lysobacteraceae bacterium]
MPNQSDSNVSPKVELESASAAQAPERTDDIESAKSAGLVYVRDSSPGIRRRRAGKNFWYAGASGKRTHDAVTLERIRKLAIPPAYVDVWICANPRGHLQATGRDARGRKQYRYHPRWRSERDQDKFGHMLEFVRALPALRRRVRRDLALPGLPRDKVLATVVALLAQTLIRVGNASYARENKSFGLTTLRNRHLSFARGGVAQFSFRGKSGLDHEIAITDARLIKLVRRCQQLPGQQLFQYVDDDGAPHPLDSSQVNAYLHDAMGGEFTAKNFRTWGGTLAALVVFSQVPLPQGLSGNPPSESALRHQEAEAVKQVAALLRNTPSVCRKSYIHPEVFVAWREGALRTALPENPLRTPHKLEVLAEAFLRRRLKAKARASSAGGSRKPGRTKSAH